MSKQKFDLSNVGGQPKDWAQKSREYDIAVSWWDEFKYGFGFWLVLAATAIFGLLAIYGLLQIGG